MQERDQDEKERVERVAAGLILLGIVAVVVSVVISTGGCAASLAREREALEARQREVVGALTRAREGLAKGARRVAELEGALAIAERRVAAKARDLELARAQLVSASDRIDAQAGQTRDALARTRKRLLDRCRALPSEREILRALRRRGERRVRVLSRHADPYFVLLVAVLRQGKPDAEVRAIYQSKLMAAPAELQLARVAERKTEITAAAARFQERFVHVSLERRWRDERRIERVKIVHFILRPGDGGVELACATRGDELRRRGRKGPVTFTRTVQILATPDAATSSFQLRVMNATMSEAVARSAGAAHGAELWRYDLGESGRCAATLVGRVGKRYALEGLH